MKITILHLPYKELNPNSRVYRAIKIRVARQAKDEVIALVREQGYFYPLKTAHLSITFISKDWRRRDMDNLLSALKSSIDGLVGTVLVDDSADQLSISLKYEHGHEYATVMEVE